MNKALTPLEKSRQALLGKMTPELQKLAVMIEKKHQTAVKGVVMIRYDIGVWLKRVIDEHTKYGSDAVGQLAAYLNYPGGATGLYTLRNFADTFTREFVLQQSSLPMADGRAIETNHFFCIMRVANPKEQLKLFDRVRRECWTANQLETHIRASLEPKNRRQGGRKPQRPTSPAAGLQKLLSQAKRLDNFLDVLEDNVFTPLEELSPDKVDERLVERFLLAKRQVDELIAHCTETREKMSPVEERLTRVMQHKTESGQSSEEGESAETEETDDVDFDNDFGQEINGHSEEPAKKQAAPKTGKKTAKKPAKKATKSVKRRQPVAV